MLPADFKHGLRVYLQDARDVMLWKLDGLAEYDVRRPMTPTGSNLLGLVKHVAGAEAMYFGTTFGRPFDDAPALWFTGDAEPTADMWASADETRDQIVDLYRRVWAHSDRTIESTPLDAKGRLPWGSRQEIPLHRILVHMTTETFRHAGHADIIRELIDGTAGQRPSGDAMPAVDGAWWTNHRNRLERIAQEATGGRPGSP